MILGQLGAGQDQPIGPVGSQKRATRQWCTGTDPVALAEELAPHLPRSIDLEVAFPDTTDLWPQRLVPSPSGRYLRRVSPCGR